MKRTILATLVALVLTVGAFTVARAQVSDTVVDSTRLVECAGTTDSGGFLTCAVPNYQPDFSIAGVDPVLRGPVGGQRNLPSATIYVVAVDETADTVRLRIIGTEIIFWPHDGHLGPIPYRSGAIQLQLQLFLDAAA